MKLIPKLYSPVSIFSKLNFPFFEVIVPSMDLLVLESTIPIFAYGIGFPVFASTNFPLTKPLNFSSSFLV